MNGAAPSTLHAATCEQAAKQTAAVGQGPHVAEEAGDGAPGRG